MTTVFVTGFPGFLGGEIVSRLAGRADVRRILCLIEPRFLEVAEARRAADERLREKVTIFAGDVVMPDLGLNHVADLQRDVSEIYHIAAVYDLAVDMRTAMDVNVQGTRRVLDFALGCSSLRCFHYLSTCYVSGRVEGEFREQDLVRGQPFNNHYERSKYLAEVEVQAARRGGLPSIIYRPSIVIGDSESGRTGKYDGPYGFIRWMMRFERAAPVVVVGNPRRIEINLVPLDYVIDAIMYLSRDGENIGRTYQLCDPAPMTVDALLKELARIMQVRLVRLRLPRAAAQVALQRLPQMKSMGIPPQSFDYFTHPTRYRNDQAARDLSGSGITCPPLKSYLPRIVDYVRAHPQRPER